jgi:biopolymer transport protein ExbD
MTFQGKTVTKPALRAVMSDALPPNSRASLLIEADKDVPFDDVVYVMDLAKQLKVEKLGVAVIPESN